jgi:phage gpG-like protein
MPLISEFLKKIDEIRQKVPEAVQRLPGIAKVEGLQFISDNFDREGFEERPGTVKAWQKKKTKGASKKTLIREKHGGSLKQSWSEDTTIGTDYTAFGSQLPYAEVHNEGLKAGRPPGFTMPKREMIGDSEALMTRIENKFNKIIDTFLK